MRGKYFFATSFSGKMLKSRSGRLTTTVIMDLFPVRVTTGCWTVGEGWGERHCGRAHVQQ